MAADSVYEKALKVFEKQVHEATQIWYASRTMDEVGLRRKRTIEALNATPLFWITVRGGLAQYALVALGRVFNKSSPRNMDTILRLTYESREHVFSKHALARRKQAGSDNADEWLAAFMERASAPAIADFKRLSRLVKKYRKIYETQYSSHSQQDTGTHGDSRRYRTRSPIRQDKHPRSRAAADLPEQVSQGALGAVLQRAEAKAPADAVFEQKPHSDQDVRFA